MTDIVTEPPDDPDQRPAGPLLRDPPPPPGDVNPVEQSELLERPFSLGGEA